MPLWLGIVFGLMLGLVCGVTSIAVTMSGGFSEWVTPVVIGPTIGAFWAAMVGVGGAIWSHNAEQQSRKRDQEERTHRATSTVFASMLELVGLAELEVREFERMAKEGKAQPHLQKSYHENMSRIILEVQEAARSDDLHPHVASNARNIARSYLREGPAVSFPAEVMLSIAPLQTVPVPELDRHKIAQMVPIFRAQITHVIDQMRNWHEWYNLTHNQNSFEDVIQQQLDQVSEMFQPLFKL